MSTTLSLTGDLDASAVRAPAPEPAPTAARRAGIRRCRHNCAARQPARAQRELRALPALAAPERREQQRMRALAGLAGRDLKNVLADVTALEVLGLIETEGRGVERHRKAPRTGFDRLEVQVES